MARKNRIHFRSATYYVVVGGFGQTAVFKSTSDKRQMIEILAETVVRFELKLYAYCIVKDQLQLVVQVGTIPLAKAMQNLSFRYTRYFNVRHSHDGQVFGGRYKASVIEPEPHLSNLVCIVCNTPVRERLVKYPNDYTWSCYDDYIGKRTTPWLDTETVLSALGSPPKNRMGAFDRLVNDVEQDALWSEQYRDKLLREHVIGSEAFIKKALKPRAKKSVNISLSQLVRHVCQEENVKPAILSSDSRMRDVSQLRQIIAYLALDIEIASLNATAKRFGRSLSTMSRNQRYFREMLKQNSELRRKVKHLRAMLIEKSAA